ncbi:MAG: 50S ribosomal protein L9 [Candidatus Marinimicrobia bacterium]|nr:50S ribosomal protein L9 [Candidatus Neomarinimicrobiota bacterium]|tara:strand:+ start:344 stop:787 length:444 start_codon:yes stop_codon:yes gene_type:complete
MDVILLDNISNLGNVGDIIKVKPGYARNFLFPKGLAVRSSKRNIALANERKNTIQAQINREKEVNEKLISSLKNIELSIEVEVGEEDRLFGSVTNLDVHKALSEKGIDIDKQNINLENPIKSLGVYDIPVKVASSMVQEIKVYVIKK